MASNIYDSKPWQQHYPFEGAEGFEAITSANLGDMVRDAAAKYRTRTALSVCLPNGFSTSLTFAEVDEMSDAFCAYLTRIVGIRPGDRVALQLPNSLAYPVAQFGIWKAGAISVNVSPLYTARELEEQLRDSGARMLVGFDQFTDKLEQVATRTQVERVVISSVTDFFPQIARLGFNAYLKATRSVPFSALDGEPLMDAIKQGRRVKAGLSRIDYTVSVQSHRVAALQYTGGTTGVSKGTELTHSNILSNVAQAQTMWSGVLKLKEHTTLTPLPMYHVFAMFSVLLCFSVGIHNVLVPNPRPISNLQKVFTRHRITFMTGVNTLFSQLLNEPWFRDTPPRHLEIAIAGGTALQNAVAEEWFNVVGHEIYQGYGITETSPVVSVNPVGGVCKRGSIGVPLPGTDIRIVDDEGELVPQGKAGEILVRGPQVMRGYWNNTEATEESIKDGWFYTGDVAEMDEDGYLKIVDRKKDMIIVSGFNVYPNEVEDCLVSHAGVADAGVIGVPDTRTGEAVHAYVVKNDDNVDENMLRAHCEEALTGYKIPARILFISSLPKSGVGKVLRKELRRIAGY